MNAVETHWDVVIIGAGISGISAAWHLQTMCPDRDFTILEGRSDLGGTWDLFRYPGVRSDSDMHTLGFAFKPWVADEAIAHGPAIMDYLNETVDEFDIRRRIQFDHHVRAASWSTKTKRWSLSVTADGATKTISAAFMLVCTGYYSYRGGHRPDFPGEETFTGPIIHPQEWPDDLDYVDKRVVVVGSGSYCRHARAGAGQLWRRTRHDVAAFAHLDGGCTGERSHRKHSSQGPSR